MRKQPKRLKFTRHDSPPEPLWDKFDDDFDDSEDWEADYELLEKKDYKGLLEYRMQVAERNPDDFYAHARVGEAYNWVGEHEKAISYLTPYLKQAPYHGDIQYAILDALFALGKTESDFEWPEKPDVFRLTKDVLDACYDFLKPKRKPATISDLHILFVIKGYVRFSEEDLLKALSKDERFIIENPYDSPFSAKVQIVRKRKR